MNSFRILLLSGVLLPAVMAGAAVDGGSAWPGLEGLPSVAGLPDLFTFSDGSRVKTAEDWIRRRGEMQSMLQYYQYGRMPPRPDRVVAVETGRQPYGDGLGTVVFVTLEIGSVQKLELRTALYLPSHKGKRPVLMRDEGRLGRRREAAMFLEKGYVYVEYLPHDLDPDRNGVVGPAQAAHPDHDWATLAVWAWGAMRVVDYLETRKDIDPARIAITGHSRSGKMALLAAALDGRFSLAAPHQSGAGGAGCYRLLGPGAETLAQNDKPHWYHSRIRWFCEQEERLPFDQHFLKALVAPRALLCTESFDDEFANPLGSLATSVAAQAVFEFLEAPDKNGIHFRRGGHSTESEDFARLLAFCQWQFFAPSPEEDIRSLYGKDLLSLPATEDPMQFWSAPFFLPAAWRGEKVKRAASSPPDADADLIVGFKVTKEQRETPRFAAVGAPENPHDRNIHGQGRYGGVPGIFEISTKQVTHVAYACFLNSVARQDPNGLYHDAMARSPGHIHRLKTDSGFAYVVDPNEAPTPVTHVDWLDAVRYCNWMHNGCPEGPQGPDTTEDGAYTIKASGAVGPRRLSARYFLPSENEWYKSAYYISVPDGKSHYIHFPPLTRERPIIDRPSPKAVSPWGLEGYADRIWEWTETPVGRLHRVVRSAAWFQGNNRQAAGRFYSNPEIAYPTIGFRIARPRHGNKEKAVFGVDRVWTVHIKLKADAWEGLMPAAFRRDNDATQQRSRRPRGQGPMQLDFEYVQADVEFDDAPFGKVGLRYKGNSSFRGSLHSLKRPFKIDFDRFVGEQNFHGLTKLNFSNNFASPEFVNEALAYALFHRAGVTAARTAFARVYLTVEGRYQRKYLGLYTMIEQVDEHFLVDRFGTKEGLLLKPERVGGINYLGDDWTRYEERYEPKSDVAPGDAQHLMDFARFVNQSDDAAFQKDIASWIDLKNFARFIAVNALLANFDSFLLSEHNFYMYLHPETRRFLWLPWDLNEAFGFFPMAGSIEEQAASSVLRPFTDRHTLLVRLWKLDSFKASYREAIEHLAAHAFKTEDVLAMLGRMRSLLAPIVKEEPADEDLAMPAMPGGMRRRPLRGGLTTIEAIIRARMTSVAGQLAGTIQGRPVRGGIPFRPRAGEQVFVKADLDADRSLSAGEFAKLAETCFDRWRQGADKDVDERALTIGVRMFLPPPPSQSMGGRRRRPLDGGGGRRGEGPDRRLSAHIMQAADQDGDRRLTRQELSEHFARWFKKHDADKSGDLSRQEFDRIFMEIIAPGRF